MFWKVILLMGTSEIQVYRNNINLILIYVDGLGRSKHEITAGNE